MAQLHETDFSFKPNVDISAIANTIQRKRQIEIEAEQAKRAQKFQELTQTISLASGLASTMVQHSKDRQKQEFVKSLSEAMASTVPQRKMEVQGPTLDNSPLPPMMAPDVPKQNLMRSATMVAPDEAAKFALKTANPAFNDSSLSFQRMTLPGKSGKNRTINVGVMGTQLVNPITKQPFQGTPDEVDAMPEYGFVEREEYAGTDNAGNPIYRNPVDQTAYTKDAQGKQVPYNGPILPKLQNPSDQMSGKVQFISETRSNLQDAISNFNEDFTGPVAGRVSSMKEWANSLTDEKQVAFNQFIEEINLIKRNEMFGATLTEGEKRAFDTIALDRNVSPKAFLARLKALERKLGNKEKALMKSAKVSGKVFRDTEAAPTTPQSFDLGDGFSYSVDEE